MGLCSPNDAHCIKGNWCNLSLLSARKVAERGQRLSQGLWYVDPLLHKGSHRKFARAFDDLLGSWGIPMRSRPFLAAKMDRANLLLVPWLPEQHSLPRLHFFLSDKSLTAMTVAVGGGLKQTLERLPDGQTPSLLTSILHIYFHLTQTDFECVHPHYMSFLQTGRCEPTEDDLIWRYSRFQKTQE